MNWKFGFWGFMAMCVVGAVCFFAGSARDGGSAEGVNEQLAAVVARLEQVEERMQLMQRQAGAHAASTAVAAPRIEEIPVAEDEDMDPEERRESAIADAKAQYESLENSFQADRVDRVWAAQTQQKIEETVGKFQGSNLVSAECKSSMCRLEMQFDDRGSRENFETQHFTMEPFTDTSVWIQRFPDDSGDLSRIVMMVAREGQLPL